LPAGFIAALHRGIDIEDKAGFGPVDHQANIFRSNDINQEGDKVTKNLAQSREITDHPARCIGVDLNSELNHYRLTPVGFRSECSSRY
jgi:hypothetical protein